MQFDVAALGRIAVDLYGEQKGTSLEDTATFRRYVGGSSGNLAIGCARLGLKTAMISSTGEDPMGRYIRAELAKAGVDNTCVTANPQRRTALAFLGMQRADAIALDFYRDRAADMAVGFGDREAEKVRQSRLLALTGTHMSEPGTADALRKAVETAREAAGKVVLDIDFRKALWEQSPGGIEGVVSSINDLLDKINIVVGNEEEFLRLGGSDDIVEALKKVRGNTSALLVLKLGAEGSIAFAGEIPPRSEWRPVPGFKVGVLNVVGAGDAFLAGFLSLWLQGEPVKACLRRGNLNGALVVSRHACSDAMPFLAEIETIEDESAVDLIAKGSELERLHAVLKRPRVERGLTALAFDHRVPFAQLIAETGRSKADAIAFKKLIARAAKEVAGERGLANPGVLIDQHYGTDVMEALTEDGWWVGRPVEETGSRPLRFEAEDSLEETISAWNPKHVAKVLVWYHPGDDIALKNEQQASLKRLQACCRGRGQEWMLEVILPLNLERSDALLIAAVGELYAAGLKPDWLKLSGFETADAWDQLESMVKSFDPYCRGVILLGLSQPIEDLRKPIELAAQQPFCQGFAVGRSIFMDPARKWFAGISTDEETVNEIKGNYAKVVDMWSSTKQSTSIAEVA